MTPEEEEEAKRAGLRIYHEALKPRRMTKGTNPFKVDHRWYGMEKFDFSRNDDEEEDAP
jgi:hypothetical protein